MSGLRNVAIGVAHYLGEELQLDAKDTDAVRFGLETFLGMIINVSIIIGIAWWLGIVPYVLSALVSSSILRLVSGGAHCSTYLRCLILGTIIMLGIGQLATMILISQALLFVLLIFLVVWSGYNIYKWVPADTPAKPIISSAKKKIYRKLSYIYIAVWTVVVSILAISREEVAALMLASIGGVGWQIFSITPAGYRFIATIEMLADKFHIDFKTRKQPF
jgi:accessory gene regulator B